MSTDRVYQQVEKPSDLSADAESTAAGDPTQITVRLKELLAAVLSQNEGSLIESADDVAADADFAQLGVNSVDFLEFVTSIEREFHVDVPDEVLSERSLISLNAWTHFLLEHPPRAN